jgi:serine/threonine protein kinase
VYLKIVKIIIVGDGATSVVVKALRNKDPKDPVAIKKVKRVFDQTAFAHRAMRELRILRCLSGHENVIYLALILRNRYCKSMTLSCRVTLSPSTSFTS